MSAMVGSKKEQIRSLLKSNCTPSQAANAVGCSEGYISQLLADEEFSADVIGHRIALLQSQASRDQKYDSIEDKLIEGLEMKVQQGIALWKPDVILRAIHTINGVKRRNAGQEQSVSAPSMIINLILPQVAYRQFQVNNENEVISVGDKALVSMPASSLLNMVKQSKDSQEELNNVTKLPSSKEVKEYPSDQDFLIRRIEEATISIAKI